MTASWALEVGIIPKSWDGSGSVGGKTVEPAEGTKNAGAWSRPVIKAGGEPHPEASSLWVGVLGHQQQEECDPDAHCWSRTCVFL